MSAQGVNELVFWGHVSKSAGCWVWTGSSSKPTNTAAEYGKYGNRGVAHRVAYELRMGPVPDGLELDHLCGMTMCVNPAHLEPVTRAENMRRRYAAITACKRGHDLTAPGNTIGATKSCRVCQRLRKNERRALARTEGRRVA